MASDTVRAQVGAKWQDAFTRLNRSAPGITGLMTFSEAWKISTDFMYPRNMGDPPKDFNSQEVRGAFDVLMQCRMLPMLLENFIEDMRKRKYLIEEDVTKYMEQYKATGDPEVIARLVYCLAEWFKTWSPGGDPPRLGHTITSTYIVHFQTHVFSALPPTFAGGFKKLVAATIQATTGKASSSSASFLDPKLWTAFEMLGLVDRYESLIASVCYEHIENYVLETCTGKWDEPMLSTLREWMADKVVPWMLLPYARGARNAEEARTMLQGVGSRFDFHVCKTLCDLRTKEIFDIIVDYPESTPALQDLKECLARVDQRSGLVQSLRRANKKRLLHPGADTKDILTQYVSIIRCLRIVDPPGVLLFKVADPIRRYLRERPDTIRCIVASLVGDGESGDSLVDDSDPIQPLQSAQVDDYLDPNWEPEPTDAGPEFRTNKPSDVISTLVSIYDSKDLFVKELQVLLAQRLLAITDGNFEKERRNIEILKVRFGEGPLQVCEVMLKDMTDSRRIDQHVQSQMSSIMHPTIISRHFWPPLQTSTFSMPGQFNEIQATYAREYVTFKPDKKLRWLPHLGTIQLDIELQDRTVTVDVAPLEAAFIELFSKKGMFSLPPFPSAITHFPGHTHRRMDSRTANFTCWFRRPHVGSQGPCGMGRPRRSEGRTARHFPVTRAGRCIADESQAFRIENSHRRAAFGAVGAAAAGGADEGLLEGYDRSVDQLAAFMEAARREGLVTVKDGMWRLNR
ncbi:hypothetical protein EW146_g4118 [Bondarzewia mesenterica]|uniref:Cullin family profile domain-containing protein n=1 Tax=Bondarzewia mesenterica TaxID=1095465 RepID=A0A4S4LXC0_9AGAM|nr:hypothetical protein EW146_g4118 [Bondarzewia mesenterica]